MPPRIQLPITDTRITVTRIHRKFRPGPTHPDLEKDSSHKFVTTKAQRKMAKRAALVTRLIVLTTEASKERKGKERVVQSTREPGIESNPPSKEGLRTVPRKTSSVPIKKSRPKHKILDSSRGGNISPSPESMPSSSSNPPPKDILSAVLPSSESLPSSSSNLQQKDESSTVLPSSKSLPSSSSNLQRKDKSSAVLPSSKSLPSSSSNLQRKDKSSAVLPSSKSLPSSSSNLQRKDISSAVLPSSESLPSSSSNPQQKDILSAVLDSSLVAETWHKEPWANTGGAKKVLNLAEEYQDRALPPHISQQDLVRQGEISDSQGSLLVDLPPVSQHLPVATLSHGLDRVLFNPGVHWLQDPRSRVYNFTPWLEKIPKVNHFAFERLSGFIKSSRDEDLRELAKREGKKYAGSTSSLSGLLSHVYFLLSQFKDVDFSTLSQHFKKEAVGFTAGQRMPATVVLNYKDGVYAIDSHTSEFDDPDKNVLTWMGTLLENFLTKPPEEFKTFITMESTPMTTDEEPTMREAFRFAKSKDFVMRSQLDCQDNRLPGTGVFDIKTRACVSIRMDILNYEENAGYMIKNLHGVLESFEREYYDLIRSAFLKYSFQARIGNMDGVMVTYHNTERIFGFQYIPLKEMDERLFGSTEGVGDRVFSKCIGLLEAVVAEATALFPEQSVKCTFETMKPGNHLSVFVQPEEWVGNECLRPLKKLDVSVQHFLDGASVRASDAMRSTSNTWTTKYKIAISTLARKDILSDLKKTMARKRRSLVLPSSVSLEEAKEFWENLNFNKRMPDNMEGKKYSPEAFSLATGSIERYREMARKGRLFSEELAKADAGKPKIVYGEGSYEGTE
ncbi:mitochondrial protein Pet127-domain-containing protein [Crassisporium funariophilum]|nr:mitochondrial protein Pet127-domain-containing protein [Crassisporium funariophilum]